MSSHPKILVILGPTASGKSALAVRLAKKFNGEIISADSRQVYTGLDIGTGKVTKKEMAGIPHHLLDVASPKKSFSVISFKELAEKAVADISARGKLPIVCGGTGFYISALIDNVIFPDVPPNKELRAKLKDKSATALLSLLKKLDPARAKTIEPKNLRRVIRAIEIATALGKVPTLKTNSPYNALQIGITTNAEELKQKIATRLLARLKAGMVAEAQKLHSGGLSWKRMNELGLEYRYLALHLQGKMTEKEMTEKLTTEIWRYAKRQMTWWKKDTRIQWFPLSEKSKIETTVEEFLRK